MNTIQSGNRTQLTGAIAINKLLENKFYDIGVDPMTGYYLEHRPSFVMPSKIYGDCSDFVKRVLKTFSQLNKGMSVLLSGPKGCGKTMTAKKLCLQADMPVICVSSAHCNEAFKTFLTNIPNPCVVFIDEFEKVYEDDEQRNYMLSLLDGSTDNKHLFVLTSNSENIGEYFSNRPGRVRYHKHFEEFSSEALHEMVDDKVKNARLNKALHKYVEESGSISPDVMSCVIEECLIHNETPDKFKDIINVRSIDESYYDVYIEKSVCYPIEGLTREQLEMASVYIKNHEKPSGAIERIKKTHPHFDEYEKYVIKEKASYIRRSTRLFERFSRNGSIEIEYAYDEKNHSTDSFYFNSNDVKEIRKAKDGWIEILVKSENLKIKAKKSAPFKFTI